MINLGRPWKSRPFYGEGVVSVRWQGEQGVYERRLFVSRSDDVVVLWITGPRAGSVDCDLQLAQPPSQGQGGWGPEEAFAQGIAGIAIGAEDPGFTSVPAVDRPGW